MAGLEAGELDWYPLSRVSSRGWRLEPREALLWVLHSLARVRGACSFVLVLVMFCAVVATARCLRLLCFSVGNWSPELPALPHPQPHLRLRVRNQFKTFW